MSGIFDPGIFDSGIFDTPSGGSSVTRTTTDAPTTSDAGTRTAVLSRSATEAIATADAATVASVVRTTTDAPTTSDVASRVASLHKTTTEAVATTDVAIRSAAFPRTTTDAPTTADTVARITGVGRSATDAPHTSEAATRIALVARFTTDAPHTSDVAEHGVHRTTSDAPTTADVVTRIGSFHKAVTDVPHTSDVATKGNTLGRTTTDSLQTSESISRHALIRTTTDAPHTSDAVTRTGSFHKSTIESVRGLTNAINNILPPVVPGVAIYINGVNVAKADGDPVLFASARFMSAVNGVAGTCSFRARDDLGTANYVPGDPLELIIDGERVWTGFVSSVKRVYVFPALNVTDFGPTRFFDIEGVDLNILFQKRIAFNKAHPENVLAPLYGHFHSDVDAISDLVSDWLDLSGDAIDTSTGVTHVGYINEDQDARAWEGSDTWGQAMTSISMLPAAIFYIRPNFELAYVDDDTPDAPFALSDVPSTGGGTTTISVTDDFNRTVAPGPDWGTGAIGTWGQILSGATMSVSGGVGIYDGDGTNGGEVPASTDYDDIISATLSAKFRWPTASFTSYAEFALSIVEASNPSNNFFGGAVAYDGTFFAYGFSDNFFDTFPLAGAPSLGDEGHLKVQIDSVANEGRMKFWADGDIEPDWQVIGALGDGSFNVAKMVQAFFTADTAQTWNIDDVVLSAEVSGGGGTAKGYREMEILLDGTNLANDVLAWGAGYGSNAPVFVRDQDSTSIADHNRWQLGQTTFGVYKQATINRIADSILNGSPEHHRGQKDDRTAIMVTTFEKGLLPAQKVEFTSNVFGYTDVIPIRKMEVTFPAPDVPRYELTLSHEIDAPWSFFDPFRLNFRFPGFQIPPFPVIPQPPSNAGCPPICQPPVYQPATDDYALTYAYPPGGLTVTISGSPVTVVESDPAHGYFTYLTGDHSAGMVACYSANFQFDTFNRVEASTWGMSTDGHTWTTSLLSGATVSVDGTEGTQFVNSGTANETRVQTNPDGPWTLSAWTMTTDYQPIFSTGGGVSIIDIVNPDDLRVTGIQMDPSASTFRGSASGSPSTSFSYVSGTHYTVKWEMVSWVGEAQHWRAKIWVTGTTEPDWMLDYTNASRTPNTANNYLIVYAKNQSSVGAYLVNYGYINFDYAGKPCFRVCSTSDGSFLIDDFDRAVGVGWGIASSGPPWSKTVVQGTTTESVDGNYGNIFPAASGSNITDMILPTIAYADQTSWVEVRWLVSLTATTILAGAYNIDFSNGLVWFTDASDAFMHYGRPGSDQVLLDALGSPFAYPTGGTPFWVALRGDFSAAEIKAKVWFDSDAEPPDYNTSSVSLGSLTGGALVRALVRGAGDGGRRGIGRIEARFSNACVDVPPLVIPSGPSFGPFTETLALIDTFHYQMTRTSLPGTLKLFVGTPGSLLTPTTDYTVNNTTGVVTLTTPITDPTTIVQATYTATGPLPTVFATGQIATFPGTGSNTPAAFVSLMNNMSYDIIEIEAGTYSNWQVDIKNISRAARPLTVRPASGADVKWDGSGLGAGTNGPFNFNALPGPGTPGFVMDYITFDPAGTGGSFTIQNYHIGSFGLILTGWVDHMTLNGFNIVNCSGVASQNQSHCLYVNSDLVHHGTNLTANDWTVVGDGARTLNGLQTFHNPNISGLTANNWTVSNLHRWAYIWGDATGVTMSGWNGTNCDATIDAIVSLPDQNASGVVSGCNGHGSCGPLSRGTYNSGGNFWSNAGNVLDGGGNTP